VQVGDIAESHQRFRVCADGIEVKPVKDAVGARPTSSGDDRSDLGVCEGGVEVSEVVDGLGRVQVVGRAWFPESERFEQRWVPAQGS
jgi:hypothetical protein